MSKRVHNFSAGPGALPLDVLQEAADNLVSHDPFGMSIMEMSHRSAGWVARQEKVTQDLRDLMEIPEEYKILFVQGGASTQFASVPMNLLAPGAQADFVCTGVWSKKAEAEAKKLGFKTRRAASSETTNFDHIPGQLDVDNTSGYVHYTSNNTIYGTQFASAPQSKIPLVCDASSDILSKPFDFANHDLVYAGAQKNMGPAGVTLVIVKESLLERVPNSVPTMLAYKTHAAKKSAYNTPPVWSIYMVGLVLEWLQKQGGLEAMAKRNQEQADVLYSAIDESSFYQGLAQKKSRSLMNISFRLPTTELDKKFINDAAASGLQNLKGHRLLGGCRASIYNAATTESVEALVSFMRNFETQHS